VCGRKVCGQESTSHVLCPAARHKHHFTVSPLPEHSPIRGSIWEDALADNTRSPVPEQVAFRCDFPRWRKNRDKRDRTLIDDLMLGRTTGSVARKYGLSPGRISQLRREFHADWQRFCECPA
jgi:hypothetical protein